MTDIDDPVCESMVVLNLCQDEDDEFPYKNYDYKEDYEEDFCFEYDSMIFEYIWYD
jgi:hypothetical protein